MFIYHFVSDTQDTPKDPAGKFGEALAKMMRTLEKPNSKILHTAAVKEYQGLYKEGHFPGLGYVKKLSMNHHIETLADYFNPAKKRMPCCSACFGDRGIRRNLIPASRSVSIGNCSYCGSAGVQVVDPPALVEYFELVISAYRPALDGQLLIQLLREDWGLFENPAMNDARVASLLQDILEDTDAPNQRFAPPAASVDRLSDWEKLRDELMTKTASSRRPTSTW